MGKRSNQQYQPLLGHNETHRRKSRKDHAHPVYVIGIYMLVIFSVSGLLFLIVDRSPTRSMLFHGYAPLHPEFVTEKVLTALPEHTGEFPETWLWTDVDGVDYTTPSHNQHQQSSYCGACWIFASVALIDDRIKLQNPQQGSLTWMTSHQAIVNCGPNYEGGCNGGDPNALFRWVAENGVPSSSCLNYVSKNQECGPTGQCQDCMQMYGQPAGQCAVKPEGTYAIAIIEEYGRIVMPDKTWYDPAHLATQVRRMKAEIKARGPLVCGVICTEKLIGYTPYHPVDANAIPYEAHVMTWDLYGSGKDCAEGDGVDPNKCIDHNVELVGWGVDNGIEYWKIRNSWGMWWGETGFFRVELGKQVLGIETQCDWAVPRVLSDYAEINEFIAKKDERKAAETRGKVEKYKFLQARHTMYEHKPAL